MNIVCMYGRISSEIDMRYNGDLAIAQFNIAVSRRNKDGGVDFFRCKAFNKQAEMIEKYFHKGSRIAITATASQPPKFTNKEGRVVYPNVEFLVNAFDFVDAKSENTEHEEQPKPAAPTPSEFMDLPEDVDTEDMPFR